MKLKNITAELIKRIKNKTITHDEARYEIEKFQRFLMQEELGTIENYPRQSVICAIMEHYPDKIDSEEIKEFTLQKLSNFMNCLWELTFVKKERIYANPAVIKSLMEYIKGVQNEDSGDRKPTFIIKNWIEPESQGEIIRAEPKTL